MVRRRKRSKEPAAEVEAVSAPVADDDTYVRWRNDTGRAVTGVFYKKKEVEGWIPTRVFSLPESCTEQCEDAGLTRVGFARP